MSAEPQRTTTRTVDYEYLIVDRASSRMANDIKQNGIMYIYKGPFLGIAYRHSSVMPPF